MDGKTYYLIDFENVQMAGLYGIERLGDNARVSVFYSGMPKKLAALSLAAGRNLIRGCSSAPSVEFFRITKTHKNYLDFQLCTYAGFIIGSGSPGRIVLITKDRGYDACADFWSQYGVDIIRRETIAGIDIVDIPRKSAEPAANAAKHTAGALPAMSELLTEKDLTASLSAVSLKRFTKDYRRRVKDAVCGMNLSSSDIDVIYRSAVISADDKTYYRYLSLLIRGGRASSVFERTSGIARSYRLSKAC